MASLSKYTSNCIKLARVNYEAKNKIIIFLVSRTKTTTKKSTGKHISNNVRKEKKRGALQFYFKSNNHELSASIEIKLNPLQ